MDFRLWGNQGYKVCKFETSLHVLEPATSLEVAVT